MGAAETPAGHSLEQLGQRVVAQLQRRLALFAVEVTEEEIRFTRLLAWELIALFLSCLTLMLITLLVIGSFWDTPSRVPAIAWTCAAVAAASAALWLFYRRELRRKPVVFAQTLVELERDARALDPGVAATR